MDKPTARIGNENEILIFAPMELHRRQIQICSWSTKGDSAWTSVKSPVSIPSAISFRPMVSFSAGLVDLV